MGLRQVCLPVAFHKTGKIMSQVFLKRAQGALHLGFLVAVTVSLACSLAMQAGHADVPIAADAMSVQPLEAGDAAPYFTVRDTEDEAFVFDPSALERPAIFIAFRGGWCPYCNLHLSELRHVLPELKDMNIDVYFLSGDRPDQLIASLQPETKEDVEKLDYILLSDADASAAIAFGTAFRAPPRVSEWLDKKGRDYAGSSVDRHGVLPVPSIFAIGTDGKIAYAYTNPDYKVRLSPDELMDVAKSL